MAKEWIRAARLSVPSRDKAHPLSLAVALLGVLFAIFATAPASAAERLNGEVVAIGGVPGPGPAAYDRVFVSKFGPRRASRVLVLMPGTSAGAGQFTLAARWLARRVPKLQVWAIDRRTQALEDTRVFRQTLAGEASLQEAFDHYLGWMFNGGQPADHYEFLDDDAYPFARRWGMRVALRDARRVVRRARAGGRRKVILGGHSLGGALVAAYAAWDFGGRAGYKDVEGLVLVDGGPFFASRDPLTLEEAREALAELEAGSPFGDLLGIGIPEATGLFASIGGLYARLDPLGEASALPSFPAFPAAFRPVDRSGNPIAVTNRALFGYALDRDTSPADLDLIQVNAGELAGEGDGCDGPCDWVDRGVTPIARLAALFGQEPANAVEWFFPRRLAIDRDAALELRPTRAARFLGLRLRHSSRVDVPVYALETVFGSGRVLAGARRLIGSARTTFKESRLVDAAPAMSHLDPLVAAPKRNAFLKTVAPFLRRAFREAD